MGSCASLSLDAGHRCCYQATDGCGAEEQCCGRALSRPCCVSCTVRKVIVQHRKNALPIKDNRLPFSLLWAEAPQNHAEFVVTVEVTPVTSPEQMKRTEAVSPYNCTFAESVWVWTNEGHELTFAAMQTSTEFLLRVIRSVKTADKSMHPPDVLGSVRFTVDEDVISDSVNGLLDLPLVMDDRVCGKVTLAVNVHCTDGFPVDCGLPKSYAMHPNHAWPTSGYGKSGLEWMEEHEGTLWSPR